MFCARGEKTDSWLLGTPFQPVCGSVCGCASASRAVAVCFHCDLAHVVFQLTGANEQRGHSENVNNHWEFKVGRIAGDQN